MTLFRSHGVNPFSTAYDDWLVAIARIDRSEEMADALKSAGRKVEFIRIPGEDHYLNKTETRVRILTETERFLEQNIGK